MGSVEEALTLKRWLVSEGVEHDLGISFIYVICTEDPKFYKIGRSSEPEKRLTQLQTASPHPLELYCIFPTLRAAHLEADLHKRAAEHRVQGEWFRLPDVWAEGLLLMAADMWEGVSQAYQEHKEER